MPRAAIRDALFGWTAGAGVDAMLTDRVFGRVEYRYTDYGSKPSTPAAAPDRGASNKISVGIGVKF